MDTRLTSYNMDRLRQTVILLLLVTTILLIPVVLTTPVPDGVKEIFFTIVGFFLTKSADAVAFLLNSTERSNQKDAALASATGAVAAQAAAASQLANDVSSARGADSPAIHVDPPATIRVEKDPHADPNAAGGARPAPTPPLAQGEPPE